MALVGDESVSGVTAEPPGQSGAPAHATLKAVCTQPMCPYPQRAQYRGSGVTTDAPNFRLCRRRTDSNLERFRQNGDTEDAVIAQCLGIPCYEQHFEPRLIGPRTIYDSQAIHFNAQSANAQIQWIGIAKTGLIAYPPPPVLAAERTHRRSCGLG